MTDSAHLNKNQNLESQWEEVYEAPNIKVNRKKLTDTENIYEYRCTGTYIDISPIDFVDAQVICFLRNTKFYYQILLVISQKIKKTFLLNLLTRFLKN